MQNTQRKNKKIDVFPILFISVLVCAIVLFAVAAIRCAILWVKDGYDYSDCCPNCYAELPIHSSYFFDYDVEYPEFCNECGIETGFYCKECGVLTHQINESIWDSFPEVKPIEERCANCGTEIPQ